MERRKKIVDPIQESTQTSELSKLEMELWLHEYQIVHNQIIRRLEADEKSYESLILTISAIVAASSVVINFQAYFLLLILSIPFHILIWDQVKRGITGYKLGEYAGIVAERLNNIVDRLASETPYTPEKFVGWENYKQPRKRSKRLVKFVRFLPKSGRTALQFSASIVLVLAYYLFRNSDINYLSTQVDIFLLAINLIAIMFSIFAGVFRVLRLGQK